MTMTASDVTTIGSFADVPLHADGDDLGRVTEARFGISPGALTVVA